MVLKFLICLLWLGISTTARGLAPYIHGDRLGTADLPSLMAQVEKKLVVEGFSPVGRYLPKGLPQHGTVVVTDPGLTQAIRHIGGSAIIAAAIRVGVRADGNVSYMAPEYWYRAFLRAKYPQAELAIHSIESRLAKALGGGAKYGGDIPSDALPTYRYMAPMERFDSINSELSTAASFDAAVTTIRNNLANHVGDTSKVYEVVLADRNLAVFGVTMDSSTRGERWWMTKLGPVGVEHIAGFPYEVFVVGNKIHALYGRYRIALAYPSLSLAEFMSIRYAPDEILKALSKVAGATEIKLDN